MILKNWFESAKNIANHLKNLTGNSISLTSIRNRIHKAGFSGLEKNEFCKKVLILASFWKKILWSD